LTQIEITLLGPPQALPLEYAAVHTLAERFSPFWLQTWRDIEYLAECCWRSQATGDAAAMQRTWHHLLLAVGNFKRSAGTMLPLRELLQPAGNVTRLDTFEVSGIVQLRRLDPETWRTLTTEPTKIKGIEVPTASTLLAALWPQDHAILDVRAGTALLDLTAGRSCRIPEDLNETGSIPPRDWELYVQYRQFVVKTAEALTAAGDSCSPVEVERSLYFLDDLVRDELAKQLKRQGRKRGKWFWSEYRAEAEVQLNRATSIASIPPA
jgi:hypothetical protein